ncbi:hypothetical protein IWQ60_010357 [Tieghemiomyces parasiticus]|uniref:Superoxide dismutase copper/zinc binding domain-containing protein n=1 Tax=Tieghemiomyces parasiticus TaxID=78921 RepID=A0A9W7ZLS5_9FUNG|nr:hypothetical protein IWQ60_010357 [Tieghemiomyces parasiticus]
MLLFAIALLILAGVLAAAAAQDNIDATATRDIFEDSAPSSDPNALIGTIGAPFTNGSGVQGVITFSPESGGPGQVNTMTISVEIHRGLKKGFGFPWSIQQNLVGPKGECSRTGDTLDPYGVHTTANYACQKGNPNAFQATCALGDLSSKFGNLNITEENGSFSGKFSDPSLVLTGANAVVNRSLVIHQPGGKGILACANIRSLSMEDSAAVGGATAHTILLHGSLASFLPAVLFVGFALGSP